MNHYIAPLAGGLLLGLSAIWLLISVGRVAGISGIVWGSITGPDRNWRWLFIAGLLLGGAITHHRQAVRKVGVLLVQNAVDVPPGFHQPQQNRLPQILTTESRTENVPNSIIQTQHLLPSIVVNLFDVVNLAIHSVVFHHGAARGFAWLHY